MMTEFYPRNASTLCYNLCRIGYTVPIDVVVSWTQEQFDEAEQVVNDWWEGIIDGVPEFLLKAIEMSK